MTLGSNGVQNRELVTYKIIADTNDVTTRFGIKGISIFQACNRIPTATLVLLDGSVAQATFEVSEDDTFQPGAVIEVLMGYDFDEVVVFKGIVVKQKISVRNGNSLLQVTCKHEAIKMTTRTQSRFFYDSKDSDIISQMIGEYAIGVDVETTAAVHHQLVQYDTSDWDFVMMRAQVNNLITIVDTEKISCKKPKIEDTPSIITTYGNGVIDINLEIDNRTQFQEFEASAWDYSAQELQQITSENPSLDKAGSMTSEELASSIANESLQLRHTGGLTTEELQAWVDAKHSIQQLASIQGTIKIEGTSEVAVGDSITLQGLGSRYNGDVFVSGVEHTLQNGGWVTTLQIGLDAKWFAEKFVVNALPASALLPAVNGLQIGVVSALEGDPRGEHRIQVQIPIVDGDEAGVWARVLVPYAGENYGMQFLPEIGNEVLLGFLNDDPRQAIVMGSLFSNTHTAPVAFTDDNHEKVIVGNSDIRITLNDEKKGISLTSPNGKSIAIDEDSNYIQLEDENGNKITLDANGITIESTGEIVLKATQDVAISGANVSAEAQAALSAKGTTTELNGSGQTTIKGGMVMIN